VKAEINNRCPEVAMKKKLTYFDPHKKTQRTCAHAEGGDGRRGNGDGSDAGSSSLPSILCCVSSGVGALAVRGGGRSQHWSGHGKKTGPLTWRGTAREGDASGGMASGTGTAVRERCGKTPLVRI